RNLAAGLAALTAGHLAPQHREVFQARVTSQVQPCAGQRLAPAIITGFDIGDVDALVRGVMRREEYTQHAVLALPVDGWRAGQRRDLFSRRGYQPDGPDL